MVIDATVPSLVLLVLLVAVVVGARVGTTVLPHLRRAVRAAADRPVAVVAERWCPRVVLIDDDRWMPAAA